MTVMTRKMSFRKTKVQRAGDDETIIYGEKFTDHS